MEQAEGDWLKATLAGGEEPRQQLECNHVQVTPPKRTQPKRPTEIDHSRVTVCGRPGPKGLAEGDTLQSYYSELGTMLIGGSPMYDQCKCMQLHSFARVVVVCLGRKSCRRPPGRRMVRPSGVCRLAHRLSAVMRAGCQH